MVQRESNLDQENTTGSAKARRTRAVGAKPSLSPTDAAESCDVSWRETVARHRSRQASVSAILNQLFGTLAACAPDLWERRAYLLLVGVVYERLAEKESEISTDELIALAKVLAESRRAEHRARDSTSTRSEMKASEGAGGLLPDAFGHVLQEVYGLEGAGAS
jgi:hypothetical protein